MRQAGYKHLGQTEQEWSFVRPLAGAAYPRFHAYLKHDSVNKKIALNLHLDQKRASYAGTTAHSGEYDGQLLLDELARLTRLLQLPSTDRELFAQ